MYSAILSILLLISTRKNNISEENTREKVGRIPGKVKVLLSSPNGPNSPKKLTNRLVEAGKLLGIQVLDHVVIGDGSEQYFSFVDEGIL